MGVVDYSAKIKITFDKPIIIDPEVVTGTELIKAVGSPYSRTIIKSGEHSSQPATWAFDGDTNTYWLCNSNGYPPGWIGIDFGAATPISKMRVNIGSSWRPNAYKIQGSADASSWVDVTTGNFTNSTGWKEVTFTQVSYRYWRLYVSSSFDTYIRIQELEWYTTRNTYRVIGWDVYATEKSMIPGGADVVNHYTVRRVSLADNGYSVLLWLDLRDRILYPSGDITVAFTGTLTGPGNSNVAPFTLTFTPASISPVFNPNDAEYVEVSGQGTAVLYAITRSYAQAGIEYVELNSATATAVRYHIDDIPQ